VLVDGKAVASCLVLAPQVDGKEVLTVEGLASGEEIHPIQRAFVEKGAVQCGFCTPGFIMSTYALLTANPNPSDEEIMSALEGNLCRCTGYAKILEAVRGMEAADLNTFADILIKVGRIGLENVQVKEIDINPVIISGSRPVAVDALVVLDKNSD
jgi:xanthine dehydrogenase iron-sulfur cluster and FAD-binding subunit A